MQRKRKLKMSHVFLTAALAFIIPTILLRGVLMLMFVPSASMYPTLKMGDVLIGTRRPQHLERGDILVFWGHDGEVLIKRLIGLPGEEIHISESGDVIINGAKLDEPYVVTGQVGQTWDFTVPEGCLLFLGDNRADSLDARYWENPYIETGNVLARARYRVLPHFDDLMAGAG